LKRHYFTSFLINKDNQQGNYNTASLELNKLKIKNNYDVKNSNYLYFLGGFVEGEGSNSVSISVNKNFKYGINLQPVFNVSQHKNGLKILYSFKAATLGTGSVVEKSGSPSVAGSLYT